MTSCGPVSQSKNVENQNGWHGSVFHKSKNGITISWIISTQLRYLTIYIFKASKSLTIETNVILPFSADCVDEEG